MDVANFRRPHASRHKADSAEGSRVDLTHAAWRKSTHGTSSGCVEVAFVDGHIVVRDSKDPSKAALVFTQAEWEAFLSGARGGAFDPFRGWTPAPPAPGSAGQVPYGSELITNPKARALGYVAGMTLANAMGGGIFAATVHPSPSTLWALGGVLAGLETLTGIFALVKLNMIHKHELERLELERRYELRRYTHETLRSPRPSRPEDDDSA